ncbi:MAG: branched-chain amino acid transaminase [Chitinophagaceae bacterium]|jgi:branched-chain amino acid aminotransferase|nr:branched-chain amino acid transaminase [Chitinophagaceae bacterium]MCA6470198.1 branched-chain amino acid transaminase [Chitinophagaceae bacterium]MCA6478504.1 branched-chain amino acid transaminase [Chitinophagaceae bacterium]MCA6479201.1 branched-chain amino acid transaminase [Chitinophagaceae bacterium]MCA6497229.1 branched-chain amino acid transaminase [Chitinophagaceae bacterium]
MNNYYNEQTIIYLNGDFIRAAEAKMDFYSQSLHYGYSVFEGIRSYQTTNGSTRIFKPVEHFDRLRQSALAINMPYHWDTQELIDITYEVLTRNQLGDAYIRPVVYAPANMSFAPNDQSFLVIQAWQMAPFLGEKLLRVRTSSFQRPNPRAFHIHAKAAGHYVNSIVASQEARTNGYDEALLLDMNGSVAEAPGANVFIEKNGCLFTPPAGHILSGITRATVLELAANLAIPVQEKYFTIEEMYDADAAFFCGTAVEVIGLGSLDDRRFSLIWENSKSHQIQKAYKQLVTQPAA